MYHTWILWDKTTYRWSWQVWFFGEKFRFNMFFSIITPGHQEIEEEFNIMMTDARDSSAAVAAPGCLDAFPAVNSWGPLWETTQLHRNYLISHYKDPWLSKQKSLECHHQWVLITQFLKTFPKVFLKKMAGGSKGSSANLWFDFSARKLNSFGLVI